MKTSVIGRVEGKSKVTGKAIYSADVMRPDMLWAGFLRSPYPHTRVLKIDASRAQRLPGVKAVITGNDLTNSVVF
jgi:CO/xanthine dehydrogenase Mo-binding subunit